MTNRNNPKRGDKRRLEHGSHWESQDHANRNPSRARKKWKKLNARASRRTGERWSKFQPSARGKRKNPPKE